MQEGINFLSKETSEIKEVAKITKDENSKNINELKLKSEDLEDRSRRNNLVFFGIPEGNEEGNNTEDCDVLLTNILKRTGIVHDSVGSLFDRAHRLGVKKLNQERPRPIIVRVTFYKDKVHCLKNAFKLRGSGYGMSEDFSKATLNIQNQLVSNAKMAKDKCSSIKSFKVQYKQLVIKYENPDSKKIFF